MKMLYICENSQDLLKFGTSNISSVPTISILMSDIIFMKYLPPVSPDKSQIKNAQNILKFSTFDISNMLISILKLKIFFTKYLPPVRPKLIPKLKVSEFIEIWPN